jgi:NitT/TauT family transport system substrate-binding protein
MNRGASLSLLGGALALPFATAARAADPMRLAAPALDPTSMMFYATDKGFFNAAGLATSIQPMANGEAVTLAIAGNAVDVGCSEIVSLILAYHKGVPLTLLAPGGMQTEKSAVGALFSKNDLPATSGRDFNGKTVAVVGLNGFAQYGTQLWIDKNGGDSKTVKFVQLAGAQIGVALQDGRVDGAYVPEPFVSAVAKVARRVGNSMAAIAPQFYSSAHFTTVTYAKTHVEEIRRLRAVLKQTADWANKNPDQTALILEKVAMVTPDVIRASTRAIYGDVLDARYVQPLIEMASKYGGFASFPASELIFQG